MKLTTLLTTLFFLQYSLVFCEKDSAPDMSTILARQLIEVQGTKESYTQSLEMMRNQQLRQFEQVMRKSKKRMHPDFKQFYLQQQDRLYNFLKENMSFSVVENDLIKTYVRHYSDQEMEAALKFYRSDLGKSFTKKSMLVVQESSMVSQQQMLKIRPQLMNLMKDIDQKLQEKARSLVQEN